MKPKFLITLLILPILYFIFRSTPSAQINICQQFDCNVQESNLDFTRVIHQQGTQILTPDGQPLKLQAVNLGGWLMWEGWIWGAGWTSETQILNRLKSLVGPEQTRQFQQQIYQNFITEADIQAISQQNFNAIRIPINHRFFENEYNWQILDQLLQWSQNHNLYVILTLHAAPGGQNALFVSDHDKTKLWESTNNIEQTISLWGKIAARYKNHSAIAGYDLLNEPDTSDKQLLDLYQALIAAIRSQGDPHLVILEGNNYAKDLSLFTAPISQNQTYSFHMYTWFQDNRETQIKQHIQIATAQNTPLWNGEFGENDHDMIASTVDLFKQYQINGWAFWTWKKAPNRYLALNTIDLPQSWTPVANYLQTPFPWINKPTPTQTTQALEDFIQAISHIDPHPDIKLQKTITFP